ncbi:hypothetical protein GCM10009647_033190 [Streptomyces sanglieri]
METLPKQPDESARPGARPHTRSTSTARPAMPAQHSDDASHVPFPCAVEQPPGPGEPGARTAYGPRTDRARSAPGPHPNPIRSTARVRTDNNPAIRTSAP